VFKDYANETAFLKTVTPAKPQTATFRKKSFDFFGTSLEKVKKPSPLLLKQTFPFMPY
jgi:hypothetical protein